MSGLHRFATDPAFAGTRWIVLDFEGTTPAQAPAEPIEVGAVILGWDSARLQCTGRYEALIRPPRHAPLTPADTRQTGITPAMLAGQSSAGQALANLDALLNDPPYVTVAHHASTEAGILRRYAIACPTLAGAPMIDTLRLGRACLPGLASYALDALLNHLDIPIPAGRHRALPDASVTARLLVRLLNDGSTMHRWSQLAQLRQLAGLPPPAGGGEQPALF